MKRRHFTTGLTWALGAGVGAIGCGQLTTDAPKADAPPGDRVALTLSAAASVQDAMRAIQVAYQAVAPQVTIRYNFGASGSLAQQIHQGAPVDIFLSASPQWMDDLEAKGQIRPGSRIALLQNTLVLIGPRDQTTVTDFKDLATGQVNKVAMGEPERVPAGRYAKDALTHLGLFEAVQPKLVFGKDVRQVLSYVETGNVDAGLVYATDALGSRQVEVIATAPANTHGPIRYPVAIVQASQQVAAAQAFIDFLVSEPAIAIFQDYGFTMAEPSS